MLAGGSDGRSQIREILAGGLAPHAADEHPTDPPSVIHALQSAEDDWRRLLGMPAAGSANLHENRAVPRHQHWMGRPTPPRIP